MGTLLPTITLLVITETSVALIKSIPEIPLFVIIFLLTIAILSLIAIPSFPFPLMMLPSTIVWSATLICIPGPSFVENILLLRTFVLVVKPRRGPLRFPSLIPSSTELIIVLPIRVFLSPLGMTIPDSQPEIWELLTTLLSD